MDTERIERALHEGPPDEPIYVPGGHRRPMNTRLLIVSAGAILTAALLMGVAVGLAVSVLREPPGGVGDRVDVDALAAELEGIWVSDEITPDAWVEGLVALGYTRNDVEFGLSNFPPYERARWEIVFADEHLQIFGSFDGGPWSSMSGGPYELLADGAIHYDDIGCFITITFDIEDDQLAFGPMRTESCNADESLNNDGYFSLVRYARADPAATIPPAP